MRISTPQHFDELTVDEVVEAFRSADLHDHLIGLPFVGSPTLVDHQVSGSEVSVVTAYAVDIDLPSAAHAFVDPERLTFHEHTTLTADGTGTFVLRPDHYPKLLQASGTIRVSPDGDGAVRVVSGDLRVDLGWKGKLFQTPVERAIADGFGSALRAQVPLVEAYVRGR